MKFLNACSLTLLCAMMTAFFGGCGKGRDEIIRYANGNVKYHKQFIGENTLTREYYEDGRIQSETRCRNNLDVVYKEWDEVGHKTLEVNYDYTVSYDDNHPVVSLVSWRQMEWFYSGNNRSVRHTLWDANGVKREERDYDYAGRLDGYFTLWSETGALLKQQKYNRGAPVKDTVEDTAAVSRLRREGRNREYAWRWRLRGKTMVTSLFEKYPDSTIVVTPKVGRIDTVFIQRMSAADTSVWEFFLTRISYKGNYKAMVGPCCGGFHMLSPRKSFSTWDTVIVTMISTDGKMYLFRYGDNGVILETGKPYKLDKTCTIFMSSGNERIYREMAIEEIDTSAVEIQQLTNDPDENRNEDKKTDVQETRELGCVNSHGYESIDSRAMSYHRIRTVDEFEFRWLDDKPLYVEFDAVAQKITLK